MCLNMIPHILNRKLVYSYYGASEASVVFRRLTEISEYVVTRFRGSYLSNHLTDLHAVIFVG